MIGVFKDVCRKDGDPWASNRNARAQLGMNDGRHPCEGLWNYAAAQRAYGLLSPTTRAFVDRARGLPEADAAGPDFVVRLRRPGPHHLRVSHEPLCATVYPPRLAVRNLWREQACLPDRTHRGLNHATRAKRLPSARQSALLPLPALGLDDGS